jgi:Asp-tRNA(Asn)/Glu-tRNA(Gln) amidotransferase A subunit family amidase
VGLQIMADHGRDDVLFAAGIAIEKVLGTGLERIGRPPQV